MAKGRLAKTDLPKAFKFHRKRNKGVRTMETNLSYEELVKKLAQMQNQQNLQPQTETPIVQEVKPVYVEPKPIQQPQPVASTQPAVETPTYTAPTATQPNVVTTPAVEERKFTFDEVKKLIEAELEKERAKFANIQAPVINVAQEEYVTVVYIGMFSAGTTVAVGGLGLITRPGNTLDIPKKKFIEGLGNPTVDALLRERSLIVISGLSEIDMARYGIAYKPGEVLTQDEFFKVLDYGKEQICSIFSKVCNQHKYVIAKMYNNAYFELHDGRIDIETVKMLNEISKQTVGESLFAPILQDFADKIAG